MHLLTALNTALLASAAAAISSTSHVLHEKRSATADPSSSSWVKRSQAPRDLVLPVRVGINSQNLAEGHDHLMDISDPTSENFGKHWTPEQVHEFFSPSEDTVQEVREWLSSYGIDHSRHNVAPSRGHLQFHATVDEVEALLGTQYDVWEHTETGKLSISCDEYNVSPKIQKHIDFITPTIGLDPSARHSLSRRHQKRGGARQNSRLAHGSERGPIQPLMKKPLKAGEDACWEKVTPKCIKDLYQIADPTETTTQPGNDLGIYEEQEPYDQYNLDLFFAQFAPHIPNGTHPESVSIDGGINSIRAGRGRAETMLDLDMVYPIIYPQGVKIFQTYNIDLGLNGYTGIFNQFLDALDASYCTYDGGDDPNIDPKFPDGISYNGTRICGEYKPTNVISVSYIVAEDAYTPAYATRQCHEYMKLGLLGTSIIVASGDNGTLARFPDQGCLAHGSQRPGFPTSCPYVTSVGATQIPDNGTIHTPEVAVLDNSYGFTSGGGFSNVFQRPSYQDDAVSTFLKTNTRLPDSSTYNATSRGFPDISAIGWNVASVAYNQSGLEAGTSASAPIFAAMINLINGERIAAGKGSLGFLNPLLYKNADVFNDIVGGYNWGCNGEKAFYASEGWDPVTGLGTPNYPKLREALVNLP